MNEFIGYNSEDWKLIIMRMIKEPNIFIKVFEHKSKKGYVATIIQQTHTEDDYVFFQTKPTRFVIDVITEATLYVYLEYSLHSKSRQVS